MTTPPWSAPVNGAPGNLNATNSAAQLNQFLGAHAMTDVHDGNAVVVPDGGTQFTWLPMPNTLDFSQPITMSGTSIGRVQLPLMPVGNGADVLVSLYPDNGSGAPNTTGNPLSATMVPAAYLNQVAAPYGLDNATGALATEQNNEYAFTGSVAKLPWLAPAGDATGNLSASVLCNTVDSMLLLGGSSGTGTPLANCASTTAANGALTQPVPQPALPQGTEFGGATVVAGTTVVYAGGTTATASAATNVWAATWDAGTHNMGAWSAQTALPQGVQHMAMASWNNTAYVIGGANNSGSAVSSVYFATVSNNQLGSWQTAQSLPSAVVDGFAAAVAGWLFVLGGRTSLSATTGLQSVYYAKINPADGSVGPWLTGPSLPTGQFAYACGWGCAATTNAVVQICGHMDTTGEIQILTVTANGPASFWSTSQWADFGDMTVLPVALGNGQWEVFCPLAYLGQNLVSTLTPMPYVSVPLPATGLSNGAKYHVVMQAATTSSASDGVSLGTLDVSALPAVALEAPRHSGAWSHIPSGYSVPLQVWDGSASANGLLRHSWQDPVNGMASAWLSEFYNSLRLTSGVAEVTMHPNNPLNSNPTFTSGVTPWTAVNGTITQSSAQTHGGFAFSGLLTPTGGFPQAYAQSELIPFQQFPYPGVQWFTVSGYFYTPTTWANSSLSINWFDSGENYISTSSSTLALTGATWTQAVNFFQPPTTAAYLQIVPTMSGTPGSANTLYMSDVAVQLSPECLQALTSIGQVDYGPLPFPPIGITQLN